MQKCPNCHQQNMEGVVFCQHCGVALIPVPIATRQFDDQDRTGTGTLPGDGTVMLHIDNEEFPHTIQLRDNLLLGRFREGGDDTALIYFDLTPYSGEEKGVSRRHARLRRDANTNTLYLMDQNSTNGTKINGEALAPTVETQIHDGDEIMLGRLKLYIYFQH